MGGGAANLLGKAEIENLGVTALGDENIGGLNVAMNDSFTVCGFEGVGNLDAEIEQEFELEGASADAMLQSGAFEEFHGEVGLSAILTDFVNRADVWMIERGGGAGLAPEAFEGLRVFCEFVRQKFEGDVAAEVRILGFVDDTHTAAAEFFDDAVMRDGLSVQGRVGVCHARDGV